MLHSKKEGPDAMMSRPKFASFGRMGDDPRPLKSDALIADGNSILRDVTASTKRLSSHTAKPPACDRRLCLVPHTYRFLGRQSLGVEPAVKSIRFFTFVPTLRSAEKGDVPVRPRKIIGRTAAFLRLHGLPHACRTLMCFSDKRSQVPFYLAGKRSTNILRKLRIFHSTAKEKPRHPSVEMSGPPAS